MTLRHIDLFAGTGSFTLALQKFPKTRTIFANDNLESSKKIYEMNFESSFSSEDFMNLEDLPKHHLLTAGFPCQPYSIAGKMKGFDDHRSDVFWKLLNLLNERKPMFIILENVKNLLTHNKGETFQKMKEELENVGYHLYYKILNTCEITDLPQNRERLFIVGCREEINFDFPNESSTRTTKYRSVLENNVSSKYYYDDRYSCWDIIKNEITKKDVFYQYRRKYVRENKSGICPCLVRQGGTGGHNVPLIKDDIGIRKLTPRECFNLQGFPMDYQFGDLGDSHLYQLAGNAVSVPVVEKIYEKIMLHIDLN